MKKRPQPGSQSIAEHRRGTKSYNRYMNYCGMPAAERRLSARRAALIIQQGYALFMGVPLNTRSPLPRAKAWASQLLAWEVRDAERKAGWAV